MKAKVFNKMNAGILSQKDLTPLLTVNQRAGLMSFSVGFCQKTGLSEGHRVNFIQDEYEPKEWFIQITNDQNAFTVRKNEKGASFNSTPLAREILKSIEFDGGGTVRFQLSVEVEKNKELGDLYAIITKSAKEFIMKKGSKK